MQEALAELFMQIGSCPDDLIVGAHPAVRLFANLCADALRVGSLSG